MLTNHRSQAIGHVEKGGGGGEGRGGGVMNEPSSLLLSKGGATLPILAGSQS